MFHLSSLGTLSDAIYTPPQMRLTPLVPSALDLLTHEDSPPPPPVAIAKAASTDHLQEPTWPPWLLLQWEP